MKVALIGFGSRGSTYVEEFAKLGCEIAAVCEKNTDKLKRAAKLYGLSESGMFTDERAFFNAGIKADLCIVATQDSQHIGHAKQALSAGYDILLEKPIATTIEDCREIYRLSESLKKRVFVCHVLRYAPFFRIIKDELETGKYGKVATVNLTENVAYWHQAHSYVRGNWRKKETASPMIVAKCCHDLDILCWLIGGKCESVSSMGSLNYFTPANAPKNSAERCLDCDARAECEYDAYKIYMENDGTGIKKGNKYWPCAVLADDPTEESVYKAIQEGAYGRCVFRCDNDVVDHQVVNMNFEGNITAHLTMTAFSKDCYREIHVHCERGEIYGNMMSNILTCNLFGKDSVEINVNRQFDSGFGGHGGGDARMVSDIFDFYNKKNSQLLTTVEKSMQSHLIGFTAEESRINGGRLIPIPDLKQ